MRYLALLSAFLALPAFGTLTPNGDGTSILSAKGRNVFAIGLCAEYHYAEMTCASPLPLLPDGSAATMVTAGVCSQAEADAELPLPTTLCTSNLVTPPQAACLPEWVGLKEIPQPGRCAAFADWVGKAMLRNAARNGLREINQQPDLGGDTDPGVEDP